jgi:diphthamide biosynthesis methyltransferase
VDIGLKMKDAINQLEIACKNKEMELDEIIVGSNLGTESSEIVYGTLEQLKKIKLPLPICFIIPAEMHFLEKEAVERFKI